MQCENCAAELPLLSRADRRFCGPACRAAASRKRKRETVAVAFERDELATRVADAIAPEKLLAVMAAQARQGSLRACIWLLENVHGYGYGKPEQVAPPAGQQDELARLRELHRHAREAAQR